MSVAILKLPIPSFSKFSMWFVMTNKCAWMYCIGIFLQFKIIEVYLEISFCNSDWTMLAYDNVYKSRLRISILYVSSDRMKNACAQFLIQTYGH